MNDHVGKDYSHCNQQSATISSEKNQGCLTGIDVSHYDGKIDWPTVAKGDVEFALAKATGGLSFVDPMFGVNWHGIRSNQLVRGAYHFFYASEDPKSQAKHFVDTVGRFAPMDLPPILDVEILDNVSSEELVQAVLVWMKEVEQLTRRKPVIYSGLDFANENLNDDRLSQFPLWLADYADSPGRLPPPWRAQGWVIWQYSEKGVVQGVDGAVDMNFFSGGLDALNAFIEDSKLD